MILEVVMFKHLLIIPFLFLILVFVGCANGRIIIEKNPTSKPYPAEPHVKKGPPPWAPAHGYRAKYRYQYYPSTSVYFDVGRRLYFYYEYGQWRVSASLPARISIEIGDYVNIEMDTEKPYEFHNDVVKKYPSGKKKKGKKKWD